MALLEDVLDKTKLEAAEVAVAKVAGPDVLTTPNVLARLEQYQAATQAIIDQQAAQINDLLNQSAILSQQLATKASADSLATVRQRLTTAEATLATTATVSYVSQQLQAVADLDAGQTQALAGLQAALASDAGTLQGILSKQASYDLLLPGLRSDVDAKATAATVSSLTGQVTTLRNIVNDTTTGLATRAASTDLAALTTTVAGKALASDLTTTNNNVAANTSAIALRATTTSVAALQASVTQNTTDIATKATTTALTTQVSRIDGLVNTTVPALQADTALRLLRTGDTATGLIKGPDATAKTAYPTFQQTFGGVNSPRRTIQSITTGTTAMVALTDATGQNRTILPIGIQFLLTGSQGLLSSVTVKLGTTNGGAELYTKTYSVLTGLLGKVTTIDQPTTATPLPAGQILYATVVGGGVWTVFFDAVFLPTAS